MTPFKKISRNEYIKMMLGQYEENKLQEIQLVLFKNDVMQLNEEIAKLTDLIIQLINVAFEGGFEDESTNSEEN